MRVLRMTWLSAEFLTSQLCNSTSIMPLCEASHNISESHDQYGMAVGALRSHNIFYCVCSSLCCRRCRRCRRGLVNERLRQVWAPSQVNTPTRHLARAHDMAKQSATICMHGTHRSTRLCFQSGLNEFQICLRALSILIVTEHTWTTHAIEAAKSRHRAATMNLISAVLNRIHIVSGGVVIEKKRKTISLYRHSYIPFIFGSRFIDS